MTAILRKRGDTYAESIAIKDGLCDAVDITGYTFKLTVDPERSPATNDNNLFSIDGVILDAIGGIVEFAPSSLQADQLPGTYYYDIQMIDGAGRVRTIELDKWIVSQDITK